MTISQATHEGVEAVPVSTEAMAYLFYENGATADPHAMDKEGKPLNLKGKWPAYFQLSENCTKKVGVPRSKEEDEHGEFEGRYSSSKSGSAKFGGWDDNGLERFNELEEAIEEARALPHAAKVEAAILNRLRKMVYKLEGDPAADEEKPKAKKAKKSKVTLKYKL